MLSRKELVLSLCNRVDLWHLPEKKISERNLGKSIYENEILAILNVVEMLPN
jgi:hypothetical protein